MFSFSPEDLITHYKMQKHPEGGYYAESFKSTGVISQSALPAGTKGNRAWSTAIYFLLCEGEKSKLHKIAFDEVWHFYLGDPLVVVEILPDGKVQETVLGKDLKQGEKLQHIVPGGRWFGSYLPAQSRYSFVGCTVAPGFEFADFELGNKNNLLQIYPNAKHTIERLS